MKKQRRTGLPSTTFNTEPVVNNKQTRHSNSLTNIFGVSVKSSAGFTLMEILISIAVLGLLAALAVANFGGTRTDKVLKITATNIAFALEEAKSNALAGKGGENHGLHISEDTFIVFSGNSYNASDPDNRPQTIDSQLMLTTTASSEAIIFSRITGNVPAVSTTTISETADSSHKIEIVVGTLGDITVIE